MVEQSSGDPKFKGFNSTVAGSGRKKWKNVEEKSLFVPCVEESKDGLEIDRNIGPLDGLFEFLGSNVKSETFSYKIKMYKIGVLQKDQEKTIQTNISRKNINKSSEFFCSFIQNI